jgi:hypothetical protein
MLSGEPNRIPSRGHYAHYVIAQAPQLAAYVLSHHDFIVDDENFGLDHARSVQ